MKKVSSYVFAKVIGAEKAGDTALKDSYLLLKKTFPNFIERQRDIPFDGHIYLIAHGKSPLHNLKAGIDYSNKTSKDIVIELKSLLSHMKQPKQFKGKIILEMCHSAQPMVDSATKAKCMEIQQSGAKDYYYQYLKIKDFKLGSSSLLAEVHQGLKADGTLKTIMDTTSKLGGYLGLSMDGDFTKSGYSTASTYHPRTEDFQISRGIRNLRTPTGVDYNELQSYLETNFSQHLPYGKL